MTDLKPCPFCGGRAKVWVSNVIHEAHVDCVRCKGSVCYIKGRTEREAARKAIKAWNRRMP